MSTLDDFERDNRKLILKEVYRSADIKFYKLLFFSIIVSPFIIFEGMFIPILGQLLCLLSFILTCAYLYRTRSIKAFFAIVVGFVIGLVLISIASDLIITRGQVVFYILLGLSTAVTITYCVGISGALFLHYERASEKYSNETTLKQNL